MNKILLGLLSATLANTTFAVNNTSTVTLNEQEAYRLGAELAKTNKDASNALKQGMEDAQKRENRNQNNDSNKPRVKNNNAQEDSRVASKFENDTESKINNISDNRQSDDNYTTRQRTIIENKDRTFFTENSRRLGIVTTDSGLQYQVLKAGLGRMPRDHHNVRISYEVKDLSERSILRQTDQSVRLSHLMPALSEGIQTMREKGKTRFFIPTGLTSGVKDLSASIPENTSLIIDVELQGIE